MESLAEKAGDSDYGKKSDGSIFTVRFEDFLQNFLCNELRESAYKYMKTKSNQKDGKRYA